MNRYYFVLGRSSELCFLELETLLLTFNVTITRVSEELVFVTSEMLIPLDVVCDRSGGIVKCGELVGSHPNLDGILAKLIEIISPRAQKSRISFGISSYIKAPLPIADVSRDIKNLLSKISIQAEYLLPEKRELSSVQVEKGLLRKNGIELCLFDYNGAIEFGITKRAQPFESWSFFDYERPSRDPKNGMLPPKVARMMINLGLGEYYAKNKLIAGKRLTLLDPFCGSGTVLTEGLRLGLNVLGSDTSQKAVDDSQSNIQWIVGQKGFHVHPEDTDPLYGYNYEGQSPYVMLGDATHVDELYKNRRFDLLVTEPYMGPLFKEEVTPGKLDRIIKGLEKLYIGTFKSVSAILDKDGIFVFAEPVFNMRGKSYTVGVIDNCQKFGYTLSREIVIYAREQAFVGRRIAVMRRISK